MDRGLVDDRDNWSFKANVIECLEGRIARGCDNRSGPATEGKATSVVG
jgi:hypothetical protein